MTDDDDDYADVTIVSNQENWDGWSWNEDPIVLEAKEKFLAPIFARVADTVLHEIRDHAVSHAEITGEGVFMVGISTLTGELTLKFPASDAVRLLVVGNDDETTLERLRDWLAKQTLLVNIAIAKLKE